MKSGLKLGENRDAKATEERGRRRYKKTIRSKAKAKWKGEVGRKGGKDRKKDTSPSRHPCRQHCVYDELQMRLKRQAGGLERALAVASHLQRRAPYRRVQATNS